MEIIDKFIQFAVPSIEDEEISEVVDTLRSGWITTGPKVKKFENNFSKYIDTKNAIALSSCTAGLHLALVASNIGPGDEVIVSTLTFCSSINVIFHVGATPIVVDVDESFNISAIDVKKKITPNTKAIIPVHYGGHACNLDDIYTIAIENNLVVIEDCAHAIGSKYKDILVGSDIIEQMYNGITRFSVFSFYATKNLTTGEGGMITTADENMAEIIRKLSLHGMDHDAWKRYGERGSWFYQVTTPGYKYNMTDIQASLGLHQLAKIEVMNAKRRIIAKYYNEALEFNKNIRIPWGKVNKENSYHLYPIIIVGNNLSRDDIISRLQKKNIGTSVHFIPIHHHPFYIKELKLSRSKYPIAEVIYKNLISLPIYPSLQKNEVEYVTTCINDIIKG